MTNREQSPSFKGWLGIRKTLRTEPRFFLLLSLSFSYCAQQQAFWFLLGKLQWLHTGCGLVTLSFSPDTLSRLHYCNADPILVECRPCLPVDNLNTKQCLTRLERFLTLLNMELAMYPLNGPPAWSSKNLYVPPTKFILITTVCRSLCQCNLLI